MANREPIGLDPPAILPLALAFEAVRRNRQGELTNLRTWLEPIVAAASPGQILAELEIQLAGNRPIDLSRWVMEEMPSHEARIVDDRTDLIHAALLGMLLPSSPDLSGVSPMIGPTLFSLREEILRGIDTIAGQAAEVARDFQLTDAADRISSVRQALSSAFQDYDRRLLAETVEAHVNSTLAERLMRAALEAEWSSGFPRALLTSVGSVVIDGAWDPKTPALTISQLELKDFFVADRIEPTTMEMMGSGWARAFLAGETAACLKELRKVPGRTWRLPSIRDRIQRAKDSLAARGQMPTHLIGPSNWRLWRAIGEEGALGGESRGKDGLVGTALGLSVYEVFEDLDSVFVLALPSALQVRQQLINGNIFQVSVREIDAAVEAELRQRGTVDAEGGPGESPAERLRLRTWVLLREAVTINADRSAVVRISLPDGLRR